VHSGNNNALLMINTAILDIVPYEKRNDVKTDLLDFIAAALNEKWERDFSEPLRWTRISWGIYECPKCKDTQDEGNLTNYCPHCGQKLAEPENKGE